MGPRRPWSRSEGPVAQDQNAAAVPPTRSESERSLARLADLFVLAILCTLIVVGPPRVGVLSSALLGDARYLGSLISATAVLLAAAFAVRSARPSRRSHRLQAVIVAAFSVLYLVLPTVSDVAARRHIGLRKDGRYVSFPHDGGVLQTEAATRLLMQGRNPYSADYRDTEMALSHHSDRRIWEPLGFEENPAFSYFPYPPGTLLASLPFHVAGRGLLGWFDQRLVYLSALLALGAAGYFLPLRATFRLPFTTLLVANPIHAGFFVQGFNDILCVLFLVMTVLALRTDRVRSSALFLALACGMKQFAWILVPFYCVLVLARHPDGPGHARLRSTLRETWPLFCVGALIFLPFLAWDPAALAHSLVTAQGSVYPFRTQGLGFSSVLLSFRWVTSPRADFPHGLLYLLTVAPVVLYGLLRVWKSRTLESMLAWYAAALLVFLYVSRFFAPNYLWVVAVVASAAAVVGVAKEEPA